MLSAVFWDGGGDASRWSDAQNWSGNAVPGVADDVTINLGSGTIQHDTGTDTVNSLATTNPFTLAGGTLSIITTLQVNNTFTVAGGTLSGGTVSFAAGQTLAMSSSVNNRLTGVTVNGDLSLTTADAQVKIEGGTRFTNAHLSGSNSVIRFAPGQTLTGNVLFEGANAGDRRVAMNGTAGTLTIGPTGSIRTVAGFGATEPAYIGLNFGDGAMTLVNQGLISAEASGKTLSLRPAANWSNTGTLRALGGTLELDGTLTTAFLNLPNFVNTGGTVNLRGTLDNSGNTLTFNNSTGSWIFLNVTVSGGTVNFADGQTLVIRQSTLTGVTVNGDLTLSADFANVTIAGGTTFANAHLSGNNSSIEFAPGQTLTGNILFEGANTGERLVGINGTAGTLTIGPTGSIKTVTGFGGVAYIGKFNDYPGASIMTLVNQGLIEANNSTLILVGAPSWSNPGTIRVAAGTLNLMGTLTTAALNLPNFVRTGGTVNLMGTLNNASDTLTLNNNTGTWNLRGTLSGGTLSFADGKTLAFPSSTISRLTGVTVNGDLTLSGDSARVKIEGGTTFANAHLSGNGSGLAFAPGQILTGNILFNGAGSFVAMNGTAGTLTIGPTGSIKTVAGASAAISDTAMTLVNQGLISAEANFNTLVVGPENLTNTGTIRVNSGSTLNLVGSPSWTNTGTINVAGGTLNVVGTLTTAALNQTGFIRTGGTVNIKGTLDNSGSTLALAADILVDGEIVGGTVSTSGTARLHFSGTLTGVTLAGVAEVQGLIAYAEGGLTLDGGQLIIGARQLMFRGSNQALTGNGTVLFTGTGSALHVEANRQLTIGEGVIIVATTGANKLRANAFGASGVIDSIISTAPGATVTLDGNWTDRSTRIVPTNSTDGGPLNLNVPMPGNISVSGETDNWTYFARAGQALSIYLSPTSGVSPALGFAQLQILDPANNVIGTAAGTAHGQSVQLVGFTFPAEGTYTIRVQASPADPSATGSYLLSAREATSNTRPLVLNQQVTGVVEDGFNTDRWTFSAIADQQVQFRLLGAASPAIRFQLTGPNGFVGFTDLSADSGLVNLPTTGVYVLQASGNVTGLGGYTMRLDATSQTALTLGAVYNGSLPGSGFVQLFKVAVTQASPLLIRFDDATDSDRTEVYTRLGSPPTRQTFDTRFEANGADHRLSIPFAAPGNWYVLVYGDHVAAASNFTLLAEAPLLATLGASPNYGGVGERLQPTITGLGFVPGTQFDLVPVGGGTPIPAERVSIDSTTQAAATFDLTGAALGDYDVRATLPTGQSHSLPGGFQVGALAGSNLRARLILPAQLGRHEVATLYVEYENTGIVPMAAPILIVQSGDPDNSDRPLLTLDKSRVTGGFWTSAIPDGFANSVQIDGSGATPGVLQPGVRIRVPVYYAGMQAPWDLTDTGVEFELRVHLAGDTTAIDWPSLESELRPDWIAADAWPAVFANLQSQIGATWGDYTRMLSNNAHYLRRLGNNISSIEQLYGFEVQQAIGIDALGTIAAAVDADVDSPGLPLTYSRSFGNTITERYRVGPLGRGWNVSWQEFAEVRGDGTVIVHASADAQRRFQPDSRRANSYFSQTGDTGTLRKVAGGAYELTETSGLVTRFLPDGRLDLVRDTYGNTITAAYTNNRLTSLTHSSGKSLAIAYNATGLIASVTDPFGRTTTFGYDATNRLLLTATGPAGTDTYTYSTGNGTAREYALTSVTDPSGAMQSFEYDARGRLTATFIGANVGRTTYAYDETGGVTITDAANVFTTIFFDHNRQVARVEDNTGYYVRTQFDANLRPVVQTDAQGATQTTTWAITGAVRTLTDELGHTTTFTSGGPLNQPSSFSDARGSNTRYTYNTAGDVTATTYADNSVERTTYDLNGNPDVLTNRRGQTIDRTVNAAGQVTREARSDGTTVDYTYDASGRLRTASDAAGTTTLSYDAFDRLTRVEYPNGRWLQYTPNAAGRRTRLEDHTGFVVQYFYDSAGRLERLLDAADALIIRYTYDTAGRLSREDKGNGTFTVYGYDLAGRVANITHRAPDNSISAAFGYTYDLVGRRVGAATPDGSWTYAYDLTDQLIHAVFASTNPGVANQDLAYEYDALGNRVRTIINGATTNYTANSLNQYTAAGSTSFGYDLDGNLIQESGPGGVKTYTYDLQNRLKSVQTPQGLWQYEYDVLGNRSAVIVNGQRTEYLIDPTGLGDVVGEYAGGNLVAHYTQAQGLASRVAAGGAAAFYAFDANGNTTQLTGQGGAVLNNYSYLPFGERLSAAVTTPNPFTFVGQFGVMAEGNGLNFMRARFYSPTEGRFLSQDPLRLGGGQLNLYTYVAGNPLTSIDPTGLGKCRGDSSDDILEQIKQIQAQIQKLTGGKYQPTLAQLNAYKDVLGETELKILWLLENIEHLQGLLKLPDCPKPPPPVCIGGELFVEGEVIRGSDCGPPPPPPPPLPPPPPPPFPFCIQFPDLCDFCIQFPDLCKPDTAQALDPNEKLGASGFGPQGYIPAGTLIPYRINFENLGPGSVPTPAQPATAPAQRVEVTDQLSANFDWDTLEFTEFGFGDTLVTVPAGRANHFDTLSMTYNNKTFDVQVELTFDPATGMVSAVYQTLDPGTELPPDVLTGFLPPEDGTGIGKAHFSYTIQPKTGLASGTELRNIALIRFDGQASIATNQVDPQDSSEGTDPLKEALNTIDSAAPSSSAAALPSVQPLSFPVRWFGSDPGGAGIGSYDVYVSIDGGPFTLWLDNTPLLSSVYTGAADHSYSFYSIATDNVGNQQVIPAQPQATTARTHPWQNSVQPLDVNGDTHISAIDALLLFNLMNSRGSDDLDLLPTPTLDYQPAPYYDTSGDDNASAIDALLVINFLNAHPVEGEGEAATSNGLRGSGIADVAISLPMLLPEAPRTRPSLTLESQPAAFALGVDSIRSIQPVAAHWNAHGTTISPTTRGRAKAPIDAADEFFAELASKASSRTRLKALLSQSRRHT